MTTKSFEQRILDVENASAPFVGDSGSGGAGGIVPPPSQGDGAVNKFLKADGSWARVAGELTTMIITADQLLNARGNPPTVLPAVDADLIAQELYALLTYQHLTTDYTLGDATLFYIGPRSSPKTNYVLQPFGTNLVDGTFDPPVLAKVPASNPLVNTVGFFQDQDLVLTHNGSGELTGGDGLVTVRLFSAFVELP